MGFQSCTNYNLLGICCLFSFLSYCFLPTRAGKCSLKNAFLSNSGIRVWWEDLDIHHGMISSRIGGVTLIFSCAAGQTGRDKSSLRHKVKPVELISSPLKNNITFWLAERVFLKASPQGACFLWKLTINSRVNRVPRGCPHPPSPQCGHIVQQTHSFQRNLPEFTSYNFDWWESVWELKRMKPVGNSYYSE